MRAQLTGKLLAVSPLDPTTACAQASRPSRPHTMRVLSASTVASMLASLTYLYFRLRSVMSMPQQDSIIWAILLVELLTAVPRLFIQLSIASDAVKAAVERTSPQKRDFVAKLPRVDVFVTYCGEGIEIVLNTAKAACVQDFPPSLVRVIVLDDSHSTALEDAMLLLRSSGKYLNLYYASRNVQVSTHSKAANLNFGLSFASTLPGPNPDYVSVLDVDMIPSTDWLKTVLTSLLHQPDTALVCAIQRFYNIPNSDPLGMTHELAHIDSLWYMQNAVQEAWCGGSGFIVRRTALQQIGGFPEGHLLEDLMTSLLLSAAGWKTTCILDSMQWGLAADTVASWIRQRQRWGAGLISMCQFACSRQARHLPAVVRLRAFLWGAVDTCSSAIWTLSMITLPLAVVTGKPLLPDHQLRFQLHLAVLDFVMQSMSRYLLSSLIEFRMSILDYVSAFWMAPLKLAAAYRYLLPSVLGRSLPRFKPTGISTTGDSERAARKQGTSCLRAVLWECGGWMHALCLGACLVGVGASVREVVRIFGHTMSEQDDFRHSFHTAFDAFVIRIGWPPLFLLLMAMVKNAWIPVAYAISPPPLREREEMLCESSDMGVRYPTEKGKRDGMMKRASQSFWWSIALFYSVILLIAEVYVQSVLK